MLSPAPARLEGRCSDWKRSPTSTRVPASKLSSWRTTTDARCTLEIRTDSVAPSRCLRCLPDLACSVRVMGIIRVFRSTGIPHRGRAPRQPWHFAFARHAMNPSPVPRNQEPRRASRGTTGAHWTRQRSIRRQQVGAGERCWSLWPCQQPQRQRGPPTAATRHAAALTWW